MCFKNDYKELKSDVKKNQTDQHWTTANINKQHAVLQILQTSTHQKTLELSDASRNKWLQDALGFKINEYLPPLIQVRLVHSGGGVKLRMDPPSGIYLYN